MASRHDGHVGRRFLSFGRRQRPCGRRLKNRPSTQKQNSMSNARAHPARRALRQPATAPRPGSAPTAMAQLPGAGQRRAQRLGRARRTISEGQSGDRRKSPAHPEPRLGLRQQAHPLHPRQKRRREFTSTPSIVDTGETKDLTPIEKIARPDRRVSEKFPERDPRRHQRSRRAHITTSGGSTSPPARRSWCSKTPASPAF